MTAPRRFGMAYFGVRDADHRRLDLAEIARQGFDCALLPFSGHAAGVPGSGPLAGNERR